jgi:hypothetical protein
MYSVIEHFHSMRDSLRYIVSTADYVAVMKNGGLLSKMSLNILRYLHLSITTKKNDKK